MPHKNTFAQLPGLQKAKKILELQEDISTHRRFANNLLEEFNYLTGVALVDKKNGAWIKQQAEHIQLMCEFHISRATYLELQLTELKEPPLR